MSPDDMMAMLEALCADLGRVEAVNAELSARLDAMADEVVTRKVRVVDKDGHTHVCIKTWADDAAAIYLYAGPDWDEYHSDLWDGPSDNPNALVELHAANDDPSGSGIRVSRFGHDLFDTFGPAEDAAYRNPDFMARLHAHIVRQRAEQGLS